MDKIKFLNKQNIANLWNAGDARCPTKHDSW